MNPDFEFIKRCGRAGKVFWSYHSNMRLAGRSITRADLLETIESWEVIEYYPTDRPLPSCLCMASGLRGQALHFVVAADEGGQNISIVTVYRPDPLKWEDGCRKRRAR